MRSHDVWLCELQLTHQYFFWSHLEHSAVRCSFPQVPQIVFWSHSAARWLDAMDWHLRHLLGSFFIRLAQTHLPSMIRPSLRAWLAASGEHSLVMRWAVCWPTVLLAVGLIHLLESIESVRSPVSCSIFLLL